MKIRTLFALALLPAITSLTACSGDDNGQPSASDSAVLDTSADTIAPQDTSTDDTADTAPDTAEDDTTPLPADSSLDDAGPETSDASTSCTSGAMESESCGKCGTRTRLCRMGAWLEWGACLAETGMCTPGETRDVACERCGTRKMTCTATCEWSTGACLDQKGCTAGSTETRTGLCLDPTKAQTRTCSDTCAWSPWSEC